MRGFSLIEVMVVVAILAVAAALAVPRMLPEIHKAQLDGDSEAAANLIARARLEAMYSKRCVRVHLGPLVSAGPSPTASDVQLTAERLNSFNCDLDDESTGPAEKIDPAGTIWQQIDFVKSSSSHVQFTFATAAPDSAVLPSSPPAATSKEIRFRPNGRVFHNAALTAAPTFTNDNAILVVHHDIIDGVPLEFASQASARRRIVVQANGLVCLLDRGQPNPSPIACP